MSALSFTKLDGIGSSIEVVARDFLINFRTLSSSNGRNSEKVSTSTWRGEKSSNWSRFCRIECILSKKYDANDSHKTSCGSSGSGFALTLFSNFETLLKSFRVSFPQFLISVL